MDINININIIKYKHLKHFSYFYKRFCPIKLKIKNVTWLFQLQWS